MLSLGFCSQGKAFYYLTYASEGETQELVATGALADRLGIATATRQEFLRLWRGFSPGGKSKLAQNAGKKGRRAAYDCCFSAPKSVSVLWAAGEASHRRKILECHETAVTKSLVRLEETAAWTRRGSGGVKKEPAETLAFCFTHSAARAVEGNLPDCQLHTHALLLSISGRKDGSTGSLDARDLGQHKMRLGAFYRAELSYRLGQLGIALERDRFSFRVAAVPEKLEAELSKRSRQIRGRFRTAREAEKIVKETREKKQSFPESQLLPHWKKICASHGLSEGKVQAVFGQVPRPDLEKESRECLARSLESVTAFSPAFFAKDLERAVLEESQGRGMSPEFALESLEHFCGVAQIRTTSSGQLSYQAAVDQFDRSCDLVAELNAGKKRASLGSVSAQMFKSILLSQEEKRAVRHVSRHSGLVPFVTTDSLASQQSVARVSGEIFRREGFRVFSASPTKAGKNRNESRTHMPSLTVAGILAWHDATPAQRFRRNLSPKGIASSISWPAPLKARIFNRKRGKPLDEKTVLFVTDADRVRAKEVSRLLEIARETGAKIVFLGREGRSSLFASLAASARLTRGATRSPARMEPTADRDEHEHQRQHQRQRR